MYQKEIFEFWEFRVLWVDYFDFAFEVSNSINKNLAQQCSFQIVWKILLSKQTNAKADDSNYWHILPVLYVLLLGIWISNYEKKIFELTCPVKVLSARWATLDTDAQLRDRQDLNKQRPTTLIPTPLNAVVKISMIQNDRKFVQICYFCFSICYVL